MDISLPEVVQDDLRCFPSFLWTTHGVLAFLWTTHGVFPSSPWTTHGVLTPV